MKGSPVRVRLSAHSIQGAQRRPSMACRESERHAETTAFQRAVCIVTCNTGSGVSESMAVHYLSLLLSGKSIAGHRIAVLCVKSDCVKYQNNYGLQYCDFGHPAHLCTVFIRKKSNMSGTVSVQVVEKTKTRKQRAVKPFGQAYHNDTVTLEKLKDKKIPPSESGGRDFYCLLFV